MRFNWCAIYLAMLALALLAGPSAARCEFVPSPPVIHTPGLVARAADRVLTKPAHQNWHNVVFRRDGRSFYILADEQGVNVWALIVYFWPLPITLILAFVIARQLGGIRRAYRARDAVGEPHCRCCDYRLTGCNTESCPECGASLTRWRPRLAPPVRRTVTRRAITIAVLMVAAISLWALPRVGRVSTWFQWTSPTMAAAVGAGRPDDGWWRQFISTERVLLEHDAQSGEVIRRHLLGYREIAGTKDDFERWLVLADLASEALSGGPVLLIGDDVRHLAVQVRQRFIVFDCDGQRVVERVQLSSNDEFDETKETRRRYGLNWYRRPELSESGEIDGRPFQYKKGGGLAQLAEDGQGHGLVAGDRVLLRAAADIVPTGPFLTVFKPHLVVGDMRAERWIARLDLAGVSVFFRCDLNCTADRVLAWSRDRPTTILMFNLDAQQAAKGTD